MSCSKIFSGDLPELISEIIKYFHNDFSTLYSCILVNRLWCRLAIPLLWEDPFSIPTKNFNFIIIYLHNLNDNDLKTKLNEYEIKNYLFNSNTLFNYPNFIKSLNTWKIISSIEKWVSSTIFRTLTTEKRLLNFFLQDSISRSEFEFKRLINRSLFKLFIENEVKLNTFDIEIISYIYHDYFNDILELILQNPNFINNIKYLKLYVGDTPFYYPFRDNNENTLTIKSLSQIINSQKNLKKILFSYNSLPLYQTILNSNCSNTLNTIIFYYVNFKSMINLNKVFEQLNVLESVHIIYCYSLNTHFIQQIINLTKPLKLKSLFINEMSHVDPLQSLLQKSGDYLENFGFGFGYDLLFKRQLFILIMEYCKNISFFDLYGFEDQIIYLSFDLIEDIKQNLNYLSINVCENLLLSDGIKRSSIILKNLGQTLPFKLEYLNLTLNINVSDFEIFLKNSQNTFIKKLLINNKMREDSEDILPFIKEYIMKKRRVKYLAIMDTFFENSSEVIFKSKDLFSLKDEVKEFKLYNIKIQYYYDLFIKVYEFIKEMD
ncbi:hypothetical protein RhiirA1_529013 [Rhizophagus irregularis]|uniref:F-box domain-containing protein n=4 Tax=Rhizophagus irregularis TaxID=588596 RepID=A0A2N0SHU8_9GLOM|nr:hypothetical protein GLOIN_2v1886066 [Rhizophagus irregularis DAOM 181602=DAOM 197198]PKC75132.1 hypothetical protein RhiirA1_529013 [Rhizophagus irregularis]POG58133.1 hypothetical protein GLOIN_2v1886066 [Rhizophagus irregularis DAOM 181602=DAOM 197198]UZO26882.1 hypothetical protein OCT59_019094 [Rhizophagus irregularis]GBC34023.1 hypothetical protein GLOIN_2v1886066 [Rhizophagus irregularis DAOM 181602=DAOM 197198]|eukprot:XP_025164999.1 hypothetical protein GLOIN_2v1886066 [Rhizophagus irregularis DAOM 181602=DAOM 197198]